MRKTFTLLALLVFLLAILAPIFLIPALAVHHYGAPSPNLSLTQRWQYAAKILWYDNVLNRPADLNGVPQPFSLESGESPYRIAARLEEQGLILDAEAFLTYLIYTGMDTSIQPGAYQLSPSQTMASIAATLQDTRASMVEFVILPGWRMEEIADSLATSGLPIAKETFLQEANQPLTRTLDIADAPTHEGFLFPDTYLLPRALTAEQLLLELSLNFARHLTPELKEGFAAQGLTVFDAVRIASMVEKEAVVADEGKMIASVFLNRQRASQKFESDPTVQYALGYDDASQSWWKSPLTYADLKIDSPYNTYLYAGLPPTPICNPSLASLEAVAFPAETGYYFFRARCDGSGLHAFAETFEEHLANGCE